MTTSELSKFVKECKNIQNRIKSVSDDEMVRGWLSDIKDRVKITYRRVNHCSDQ